MIHITIDDENSEKVISKVTLRVVLPADPVKDQVIPEWQISHSGW